jgi:hypothetical protein
MVISILGYIYFYVMMDTIQWLVHFSVFNFSWVPNSSLKCVSQNFIKALIKCVSQNFIKALIKCVSQNFIKALIKCVSQNFSDTHLIKAFIKFCDTHFIKAFIKFSDTCLKKINLPRNWKQKNEPVIVWYPSLCT